MGRRRYLGLVAGLAAALLADGTNPAAAAAGPRVVPMGVAAAAPDAAGAGVAGKFSSLPPTRVLDTRNGTGTGGVVAPVGSGQSITVDLSARAPATATAVVLNVTGTGPTGPTFVTAYPTGTARPLASNLNLVAGQTRPNAVTVAVGADRRVDLYNNAGSVHLVADLAGFYATDAPHGFTSMPPERVLDTRVEGGPIGPGQTVAVDLSAVVPESASAVTFNLTGVGATANTFVTAWPYGRSRPTASSLNLAPGEVAPNLVTVELGSNGWINLYNNAGSTHLIIDLAGFYAPDQGDSFYPQPPQRILDLRPDQGLTPDLIGELDMSTAVPPSASAVVFNMIGTNATASTFVTSWPANTDQPVASNLNLMAGQTAPNLVTVELGEGQLLWFYNNAGYVDLILDMAGHFAP